MGNQGRRAHTHTHTYPIFVDRARVDCVADVEKSVARPSGIESDVEEALFTCERHRTESLPKRTGVQESRQRGLLQ